MPTAADRASDVILVLPEAEAVESLLADLAPHEWTNEDDDDAAAAPDALLFRRNFAETPTPQSASFGGEAGP
jgi:hypothetical protein